MSNNMKSDKDGDQMSQPLRQQILIAAASLIPRLDPLHLTSHILHLLASKPHTTLNNVRQDATENDNPFEIFSVPIVSSNA